MAVINFTDDTWTQISTGSPTFAVLAGTVEIKSTIVDTGIDNLHVVPAVTTLAASEQELVDRANREQILKNTKLCFVNLL